MKICTACKQKKELDAFSPDKRIASGLQSRCKKCQAEIASKKRALNPEAYNEIAKRYRQKNHLKLVERNRKYREKNKDKVSKWKQKDRQQNKHRILSDNSKRRALISGPIDKRVVQIYALRDFYIAMSLGESFHVDHIVPVSRGGKHEIDNLQVIPAIDNLRKGANL